MYIPKATFLALQGVALGARAQHGNGDSIYADLSTRSAFAAADADNSNLFDALYVRDADAEADADPEIDHKMHLLLTRDLHAHVAELEDVLLFARDDKPKRQRKTPRFRAPTVPIPGRGGDITAGGLVGTAAEFLTTDHTPRRAAGPGYAQQAQKKIKADQAKERNDHYDRQRERMKPLSQRKKNTEIPM